MVSNDCQCGSMSDYVNMLARKRRPGATSEPRFCSFSALRVEEYTSVSQMLSMSVTSLRYSPIFGIAEVGRRL